MLDRLERQTKLTANQWRIIATANIGDMLDFFDFFLIGYVLVFIVTQWKLTFIESGVILLAAGVGSIPGAFLGGLFILFVPNLAERLSKGLAGAIYALSLLLVIFVMPKGIAGGARRWFERLRAGETP